MPCNPPPQIRTNLKRAGSPRTECFDRNWSEHVVPEDNSAYLERFRDSAADAADPVASEDWLRCDGVSVSGHVGIVRISMGRGWRHRAAFRRYKKYEYYYNYYIIILNTNIN